MWYPTLNAKQKQQTMIDTFGGYNHTARPAEAEFYDMQNMCGDDFPLLSTRGKRGLLPVQDEYVGHMAKDGKLLLLKESGSETLKLTVKDAIEAAELPDVPDTLEVNPPDTRITVYSVADLTQYIGRGIQFYRQTGWSILSNVVMKNAVNQGNETWTITLDDVGDYEVDPRAFGRFTDSETVDIRLENDGDVSDGYLKCLFYYYSDEISARHSFYLMIRDITEGNVKVGFKGDCTILKYLNEELIDSYWYQYHTTVRLEVSTETLQGSSRVTVRIRIPIQDLFRKTGADYDINNNNDLPVYEPGYRYKFSEHSLNGDRLVGTIVFPYVWTGNHMLVISMSEYRSRVAEANAQHILDLEQWEEDKKTHIFLNETLTPEIAEKIKGQTIQIGEDAYGIQSATAGKSGAGELIISKPHGAIEAGAQIDVGEPYLSLCEMDPQTATETSAPIGLIKSEGERAMLSMGGKVVVFPDKIEVNTMAKSADGAYTEYGPLELTSAIRANVEDANNSVLITLCDAQYQYVGSPTVSKTAPSSPSNGKYWLDNAKSDVHLKVYSTSTNMWTEVETYLKIYSVDLNAGFEAGDAVRILDGAKAWSHESVSFLDEGDSHIIYAAGDELLPSSLSDTYGHMRRRYIVVRGILKDGGTVAPSESNDAYMTIRRTVPDLDYIVESGNRLWGCHYGKNEDGEMVNEIYACKQGDPKNWYSYEGTAMDSYTASLGTDGPFTGAAVYAGNPVFFKENYMHRVYGSYPANYQILTQAVHGVQQGCAQSLAVVNERLFYKAQDGIYVYDGSLPYLMSEVLGQQAYTRAIGADGNGKYYVSLEKPEGTRDLFVYDLQRRMWYREDDLPVRYLIPLGNTLIAVTRDRRMIDLLGRNGEAEPDVEWYAESGNIGYAIAAKKFVGRMLLRMELSDGAYVRVQIAYDNDRAYTDLFTSSEAGVGTICVPVRPHRCDHFRVRICGKGAAKLISVTKTIKGGSEK